VHPRTNGSERTPGNPVRREGYLQSVGVLAGSAVFAHGITAACLPLLSRLYTPAEFSVLALFVGIASVFSAIVALRFDIAIPIPAQDSVAINLLVLSLGIAAALSVLLMLVIWLLPDRVVALAGQPLLAQVLWLLPVAAFSASASSALQSWFIRRKQFPALAQSRLLQSAASSGTQIGLGILQFGPVGLVFGYVVNTVTALIALGIRLLRRERKDFSQVDAGRMAAAFHEYSRFPRYSTVEALFNNGSVHLPIILIALLAAGPEAGYIALAMTLLQAPMSLIGQAIGQVYLSRAADAHRAGDLAVVTAETISYLVRTGVGPLLAAGLVAPFVFEPIFGAGWHRAGILISWMTPWFVLQLLAVPIAMSLHVTGRQRLALLLQFFGLLVRVTAILVASQWFSSRVAETYALSGAVFYLAYLVVVLAVTGVGWRSFRRSFMAGWPHLLGWLVLAAVLAAAASRITGSR